MHRDTVGGIRTPNFFIVGAPKSGTTSMYDWLGQHPDVYMSPFKEPRYFCDDLTFWYRYALEADYLPLFSMADDERVVGEASVWYLYSETAARRIHDYCGDDVRILAMLRNPVEMIYSMHSQLVFMGNEPLEDFREAYHAQDRRREGYDLPRKVNPYEGLLYSTYGRFVRGLERYLDTFGEDKVEVVLFDDFVENDQEAFRQVCRFLEVDDSFEPDLTPSNPNTEVRSPALRDFVRDLPRPLKAVTTSIPDPARFWLRERVEALNTQATEREPLPGDLRAEMVEDVRDSVEWLSETLDRDLSHWLAGGS